MDGRRRSTSIILKTLGVDRFDHGASWPAKVRNVSRLGSQFYPCVSNTGLSRGQAVKSFVFRFESSLGLKRRGKIL